MRLQLQNGWIKAQAHFWTHSEPESSHFSPIQVQQAEHEKGPARFCVGLETCLGAAT